MATSKKGGSKGGSKKSGAKKGGAKSGAKGSAQRGGAKKAGAKKSAAKKTKRAPNPAFMRPMNVDEALGAVVGNTPMPRTEVTKKLWGYIKKNGLQDAKQRRMINADDRLRPVFGGKKQVSMFEMTKLVNQHMS